MRLYKALSTNFNNKDTRQALSKLYATSKSKDRLVIVETLMVRSFAILAESVPSESSVKARKQLHKDMESKLTENLDGVAF